MNVGTSVRFVIVTVGMLAGAIAMRAEGSVVEPQSDAPFGVFNGIDYVSHTGRFSGTTSKGAFNVPFEIVVPSDQSQGNGTVLFEPPHWFFGALFGPDFTLGRDFLFGRGFGYASVGWSDDGMSVLDPTATPIIIAGEEVEKPGVTREHAIVDVEILVQFVDALKSDPQAAALVGDLQAVYFYGFSQTADAQVQVLLGPQGQGLFDFSLVTLAFWPTCCPDLFDRLVGEFEPPTGIGRTIFVNTESELITSDAEQYRAAAEIPNYRVYEIAGAPHFPQPPPLNPLDWSPIMRAAFLAGDAWVRWGVEPPTSALISEAFGVDPIYDSETGIERDLNGNALGGIRLPDVELGRALFISTNFVVPVPDFDSEIFGLWVDLQCEPLPDGSARFANHGRYVAPFVQHADALVSQGHLLTSDAEAMKADAARSEVGKPHSCD
jgi:hypothetical protein